MIDIAATDRVWGDLFRLALDRGADHPEIDQLRRRLAGAGSIIVCLLRDSTVEQLAEMIGTTPRLLYALAILAEDELARMSEESALDISQLRAAEMSACAERFGRTAEDKR